MIETSNWWDVLGSASDMVVAAATLAGLAFGAIQLRRIAQANDTQASMARDQAGIARDQVDIARAELMLAIDTQFEAQDMRASRRAIRTLRNYCDREAGKERPGASDLEIAQRSAQLFSIQMTALHNRFTTADNLDAAGVAFIDQPDDKDGDRYFTFMRLAYWMETVGLLTRSGLLPREEVLNLYDEVFTGTLTCFVQHIMDRRSRPPQRNDRFLEHALWLRDEAIARQADEKAELEKRRLPRPSGLFG